jgi:cytochrome c-type biogenesis protein CcmH
MTVYLVAALLLAAVTGILVHAATRLTGAANINVSTAVYKDQLHELDRDVASGKIHRGEAASLRTEIARRLLAEDRAETSRPAAEQHKYLPVLLALMIPLCAVPVYFLNGSPRMPDAPLFARIDAAVENNDIEAMVVRVEERLASQPDESEGWQVLAPVYTQLGRYNDAAAAYEHLLRLEPPTAERLADYGEALTFASQGIVPAGAAKAFELALQSDPQQSKASYYVGLALRQDGKITEARQQFESLLRRSPAGASWRPLLEKELSSLAAAPPLTQEQVLQGSAMPKADQTAMIRGMVDGLEEKLKHNGADVSGWLRLIRARTVLGETEKAKSALAQAAGVFKDKPQELASIRALAMELDLQ